MIRRELRLFFTAMMFLTRIPCERWAAGTPDELNHAVRYFPLVGVVVGGVAACVFWLVSKVFPLDIAVLCSMAATLWLTGAFHEDGLADSADGLGGGLHKEQALAIMKDSRIGTYGATALIMMLMIKFSVQTHLPSTWVPGALIAAHALSRLAAVWVIACQRYVREEGKAKPLAQAIGRKELVWASFTGGMPLIFLPVPVWWALLATWGVWWWFSRLLQRRLGGYTGDTLGAMQQLCELAFYLGLLACR